MSGQQSVRLSEILWRAGLAHDGFHPLDSIGRVLQARAAPEDAPITIRAGDLAIRGSAGDNFCLPLRGPANAATLEADALGVVRYLAGKEKPRNLVPDAEYLELAHLALIKKGRVWVAVEEEVTQGQQAFVRLTAAAEQRVGAWRADNDGGNAVALLGARFTSNTYPGEDGALGALLQLDL